MVAPQIGNAFGQERALGRSCELLASAGHEVFLIADKTAGSLPPHEELLCIPGLSRFHTLSSPVEVERARIKVGVFLKRVQPDVVHLQDVFDFRFIKLFGNNYATILTAHTVSPTCPSSQRRSLTYSPCSLPSGWGCIPQSKTTGCLQFLKSDFHRAHAVHSYLMRRKALRRYLSGVVAISAYVERVLLLDGWPQESILRIPNPVTLAEFEPLPKSTVPRFVFAARLTPLKGLAFLIRALKKLESRDWELVVCGDGADAATLRAMSQDLGLAQRVQFIGQTTPQQTAAWIASACALVAPNIGPETFGMSVAEACLAGTPVISSDMPALNELIRHQETGLIFPAGDEESLAQCLDTVLKAPALARKWGLVAKQKVENLFSEERHLKATLAAYQKLRAVRSTQSAVIVPT